MSYGDVPTATGRPVGTLPSPAQQGNLKEARLATVVSNL